MELSRLIGATAGLIAALASSSFASGVPPQLFGKTVHVRYTSWTPMVLSNGRIGNPNSRTFNRTIYVSSTGRVFERLQDTRTDGKSVRTERDPESADWRFEGHKMAKAWSGVSGAATLMEVSFDRNFQGCTFTVTQGRQDTEPFRWKGIDGRVYTAAGPSVYSGKSCSISSGNNL